MMKNCNASDEQKRDEYERERASETPEQCAEQLRKDAAKRQREHRERETLEEHAERLRNLYGRRHEQLARETIEERAERRRKNVEWKRAERLRKNAEKNANKQKPDSPESASSMYLMDAKAAGQVILDIGECFFALGA